MARQYLVAGVLLLAAGKLQIPTSSTNAVANSTLATLAAAQQYGPPSGSDDDDSSSGNPYPSGNNPYNSDSDDGNSNGSPYGSSNGGGDFGGFGGAFTRYNGMIAAHAIMATLAFGLIFPSGGILIRVAGFPRLWLVHGLLQLLGYFLYIAAFAIGVWMVTSAAPGNMLNNPHPILGIVVLLLIIFQPVLGFVHHLRFKMLFRRTWWSYAHVWTGRVAITLGIINGGLGLWWAQQGGPFAPSQGAVIGYGVAAGLMWLIYVASAIYGERKRSRQAAQHAEVAPPPKYSQEEKDSDSERGGAARYA